MTAAFARLLAARGWRAGTPELVAFLDPHLGYAHSPWLLLGMEAAVERTLRAIAAATPIRILGDYDVDGTLATVILRQALTSLGANVSYELPQRLGDGYGLQIATVERAAAAGVGLAITVDNGIRDLVPLERARELGLDVIVTDHHLPGEQLPEAVAIVNPHQPGCPYPDQRLCGSAIAFKLAQALLERSGNVAPGAWPPALRSYLKLVAMATIADSMPLLGENRVLARLGLAGLSQPVNAGLCALLTLAPPKDPARVSSRDVAFKLAPRLNAAGRMGAADRVVELFFAPPDEAARIAQSLEECNQQRQAECAKIEAEIAAMPLPDDGVLVLASASWHRGVVGIAASRVLERRGKPVILLAIETSPDGRPIAYGSGRAPEGVPLLPMVEACGDLLERFGGHAQAVGVTLAADNVAAFRTRLNTLPCRPAVARASTAFDVAPREVTLEFARELEQLTPYGEANPEPRFRVRGVTLAAPAQILKERHLKLLLTHDGARAEALVWGYAERGFAVPPPGCTLEVTFRLERNCHPRFGERVQWIVEELNVTSAATAASESAGGVLP